MRAFFALSVSFMVASPAHAAFVIRDKTLFNSIPRTFLNFETRGDGSPVDLCCLDAQIMFFDEYKDHGFVFDDRLVAWGNVPWPTFGGGLFPEGGVGDAVQAVGSLWTAIGGGFSDGWAIHFTEPVHAFGIGAIRNGFFDVDQLDLVPQIEAYASDGSIIGVLKLSGNMVQGNFGGLFADGEFGELYKVEYGFMGLASSTPIARLEFINGGVFDDLYFSAVPAPGAGAVFVVAGALALRRRR